MPKNVCVVGAGIGGLTAGAYLAKSGYKVKVLEMGPTVGGSAGWYVRKGRVFPVGATIAFGLEEGGLLRGILNDLDIELPAQELLHPMDVILPDRKVSIYKDARLWEKEMRRAFSDRSADVLAFWAALAEIGEEVLAVIKRQPSLPVRRLYDLGTLPAYALKRPLSIFRPARYALWTVEEFMRKYKLHDYEPLRHFLNAQLYDAVQTSVTQAALLPSSVALTIYRRGSFIIEHGRDHISKSLAEKIIRWSGEVVTRSPVQKLVYDRSRKQWYVTSEKVSGYFDVVINNSGVSFGPGTSASDSGVSPWGAFRVDTILTNQVMHKLPGDIKLPFAYQIVPDPTCTELSKKFQGPVYVTFQRSINANGQTVDNEVVMTATVHTRYHDWLTNTEEVYRQRKNNLEQAILSQIERFIPIKEHFIYKASGTPLTYKNYIGKAEVGGFPLTVIAAIVKPRSARSSLPHLYIAGEQVFPGPGTLSSSLSGYYAARTIMREQKNNQVK